MDLDCEDVTLVREENALRFSIVSRSASILQYVRRISSLIGTSHILCYFDENDYFKIYFDDKRCVDYLIRSHIHVLDHHVKIEYVLPPGRKIILTDVDPAIPDDVIVSSLLPYGSVVSPVIRPPVSDDVVLCHITNGIRYVYMTVNGVIPSLVSLNYGDQYYSFQVNIDELCNISSPIVKNDDSDSSCCEIYSVRSCAPNMVETRTENNDLTELNIQPEESSTINIASVGSLLKPKNTGPGKRRKKRRGKMSKKLTATSAAANKIKKNSIKYKFRSHMSQIRESSKSGKCDANSVSLPSNLNVSVPIRKLPSHLLTKPRRGRPSKKLAALVKPNSIEKKSMPQLITSSPSSIQSSSDPAQSNVIVGRKLEDQALEVNDKDVKEKYLENISNSPYKALLDDETLQRYLQEVKHQRVPYQITKQYLGDNFSPENVLNLCKQLEIYTASHDELSLKLRVSRLVKSLNFYALQDFKVQP